MSQAEILTEWTAMDIEGRDEHILVDELESLFKEQEPIVPESTYTAPNRLSYDTVELNNRENLLSFYSMTGLFPDFTKLYGCVFLSGFMRHNGQILLEEFLAMYSQNLLNVKDVNENDMMKYESQPLTGEINFERERSVRMHEKTKYGYTVMLQKVLVYAYEEFICVLVRLIPIFVTASRCITSKRNDIERQTKTTEPTTRSGRKTKQTTPTTGIGKYTIDDLLKALDVYPPLQETETVNRVNVGNVTQKVSLYFVIDDIWSNERSQKLFVNWMKSESFLSYFNKLLTNSREPMGHDYFAAVLVVFQYCTNAIKDARVMKKLVDTVVSYFISESETNYAVFLDASKGHECCQSFLLMRQMLIEIIEEFMNRGSQSVPMTAHTINDHGVRRTLCKMFFSEPVLDHAFFAKDSDFK